MLLVLTNRLLLLLLLLLPLSGKILPQDFVVDGKSQVFALDLRADGGVLTLGGYDDTTYDIQVSSSSRWSSRRRFGFIEIAILRYCDTILSRNLL